MTVHHVHIFFDDNTQKLNSTGADIIVPGLGKVTIKDCLSEETVKRIREESINSLRIKLGQTIISEPESIIPII